MRLFCTALLLLTLCVALSGPALASQEAQTSQAILTNKDVIEMLHAGLTPEIVIAKIKSSSCDFDTSPEVLKQLKMANVPDAVILAMVQAPSVQTGQGGATFAKGKVGYVKCGVNDTEASLTKSPVTWPADLTPTATMKCGDSLTLLGEENGYYKARTKDGAEGYISIVFLSDSNGVPLSTEQSSESTKEGHPSSQSEKQEKIQKATDDRDDCNLMAQNEYETKMNVLGTLALTPMMRVAASNRLKQNLDAELRQCRTQYELRLKDINAE